MNLIVRMLRGRQLPAQRDEPPTQLLVAPEGATVADLLARLDLEGCACTVLLNGRHATRAQVLSEGDELSVFPAVGGG